MKKDQEIKASLGYIANPDQPGLHRDTLSPKEKKKKERNKKESINNVSDFFGSIGV
jgi:hypothetical protein